MSKSTKPDRVVTDFTAAEIADLQEGFKPAAEAYHRRGRLADRWMMVCVACMLIGWIFNATILVGGLVGLIGALLIALYAEMMLPYCPACKKRLSASFGEFCPECGSRSLQPGGWFRPPKCTSCGKSMFRNKVRYYKIRACTHCGLKLDEKGL